MAKRLRNLYCLSTWISRSERDPEKGHSSIVKKSFSETQGRLDWTMRYFRWRFMSGEGDRQPRSHGKSPGNGDGRSSPWEHLLSPLTEPVPEAFAVNFRSKISHRSDLLSLGLLGCAKKFFFLVFVLLGRWKVAATRNGRKHYNTSYGSEVNGRWTRKRVLYKSTFEKK